MLSRKLLEKTLRASCYGFHTSSVIMWRLRYPKVTTSIAECAKNLGFEDPKEMYPKYPLSEPPKIWMIKQTHELAGRPYWEKEIMKEIGLHKENDITIQPNTENMNDMLWMVKHLIQIQPVRLPQGIPTEEDIGYTQLTKHGEFIIYKRLEPEEVSESDIVPKASDENWKIVDGYRMCAGCKHKRCLKIQMCQKLYYQRGSNYIEKVGPQLFNYVDHPDKISKENKTNELS